MLIMKNSRISNCGTGISVPDGYPVDLDNTEITQTGTAIEVRSDDILKIIESLSNKQIKKIKKYANNNCEQKELDLINSKFDEMQKSTDKQYKASLLMQIIQTAPIVVGFIQTVLHGIQS